MGFYYWDNWEGLVVNVDNVTSTDFYTLRRDYESAPLF